VSQPTIDELRAKRDLLNTEARTHKRLSADRRRTLANEALFAVGVHPATRRPLILVGATCETCVHSSREHGGARSYWKCAKHRLGMSRSSASDIRKSWPACALWEPAL
jgi:hypothetical protein